MNYNYTYTLPNGQVENMMANTPWPGFAAGLGVGLMSFFIILIVWSIVWKALALWKSARRNEKVWFIVFLLVNTAGILEIIYLYINREPKTPISSPTSNLPQN